MPQRTREPRQAPLGGGRLERRAGETVPSETRRRTVRQVHSFLSPYGTHGNAVPSEDDVRMGFMLTFTAIRSLLTAPGMS